MVGTAKATDPPQWAVSGRSQLAFPSPFHRGLHSAEFSDRFSVPHRDAILQILGNVQKRDQVYAGVVVVHGHMLEASRAVDMRFRRRRQKDFAGHTIRATIRPIGCCATEPAA